MDLSTGERSVVYSNTDLRKLRSDAVNESLLEDMDVLMLDGYFLPQAVQLAGWARSLEIPVVLDGGSWKEGLEELLPLVDYAICSDDFYPPGCTDKAAVIDHLRGHGLARIAITRDGHPGDRLLPDPLPPAVSGRCRAGLVQANLSRAIQARVPSEVQDRLATSAARSRLRRNSCSRM